MGHAKIANLGGDQFLISFGNLENAWPAIKSSMVEFSGLFLSLNLWKPGPNYVPRIMCVRCFGVPLHRWDEKVFTTVGRRLGKVLGISKETTDRTYLEYGRMCWRVDNHHLIYEEIEQNVLGNIHQIVVKEEMDISGKRVQMVPMLGTFMVTEFCRVWVVVVEDRFFRRSES